MWTNPQFPVDLVTFTEGILNGKLLFLCSAMNMEVLLQLSITQSSTCRYQNSLLSSVMKPISISPSHLSPSFAVSEKENANRLKSQLVDFYLWRIYHMALTITCFWPLFLFFDFLVFSENIKWEYWSEMN